VLVGEYSGAFVKNPIDLSVQFQYLFVSDAQGLKVLNIANPVHPVPVDGAVVALKSPHRLYVARDYVYLADGAEGLAIIDIEKAEQPRLVQMFNAGGQMNDTRAVQIGSINASMFALVADGKNGLRVVQLISPDTVPEAAGFDPKPNPHLIATFPVKDGEALAVSRGLDRDRVVDESGNQTVVFGRRGSRPFHLDEMAKFLQHENGEFFRVNDVVERDGLLQASTGEKLHDPVAVTPAPQEPAPASDDARIRQRPN